MCNGVSPAPFVIVAPALYFIKIMDASWKKNLFMSITFAINAVLIWLRWEMICYCVLALLESVNGFFVV